LSPTTGHNIIANNQHGGCGSRRGCLCRIVLSQLGRCHQQFEWTTSLLVLGIARIK
jgi:hypothetical protein